MVQLTKAKESNLSGESLTNDTYERLRQEILSGTVKPQAKLKIREICDRLQVSQGAIREALARLTSEGLVVAEPQRGFRVCSVSAAELKDLTMARIEIESWCLRRAIEIGDVSWERDVVAAYYELSRTPVHQREHGGVRMHDAWSASHMDYHEALVSACDSPWMLRLRMQLFVQGERYRRLSIPLEVSPRDVDDEHLQIMEAALGRDPKRAKECLAEHFNATTKILLDQLNLEVVAPAAPRPVRTRRPPKDLGDAAELVSRLVRNARRKKT